MSLYVFTCGRDEKGGIRRLHPLGHGEVGQVGEGDEEGEGGDTVCYGHQEVGGEGGGVPQVWGEEHREQGAAQRGGGGAMTGLGQAQVIHYCAAMQTHHSRFSPSEKCN